MKVVVAHNRYQSSTPSGENRIVDSEIELLRAAGVDVIPFIEDSDELVRGSLSAKATAAIGPVVAPRAIGRLRRLLRAERPDVLHIHNVFPLVSPWVVRTAVAAGVPVVQTVHNYRHTCVAGTHLREGRICEDCRSHLVGWPAVQHGCYRGSRVQSTAMVIGQAVHRPTWQLVSRFLTASPHMDDRLVSVGVPRERIEWRPTFAEDVGPSPLPPTGGVAFVGRLEAAKGVELLLDAWSSEVARRWGSLVVAGAGPQEGLVQARAAADPTVHWRGNLDGDGVRSVMHDARLIAVPSLWFEGFPRVAAEAMSAGRPLLMWRGAGFSRLAADGAGWALDDLPDQWRHLLMTVLDSELEQRAGAARRFYERHCSPPVSVDQLLAVYRGVARTGPAS